MNPESWEAECSHCSSRLEKVGSSAAGGAYYACTRCERTYASTYDEVLRRNAGVRPPASPGRTAASDARFEEAKRRLEAFLRRLDEDDPFFVLGIPPNASLEVARARYHELALAHHPDRGGDARQMQRIARAFEAIRCGRARPSPEARGIAPPPVDDSSVQAFAVPLRRSR